MLKSFKQGAIMQFSVDKEQMVKINKWKSELDKKTIAKQKESMSEKDFSFLTQDGKYPYGGAIGGSLTYSFTNTSLGTVVTVKDGFTGETLDVTDYDMW
jgi:hypothetical protein